MLATLQAAFHLYYDYDHITVPVPKSKTDGQPAKKEHPISQLQALLPVLARSIGIRAACVGAFGPIIYALFIRRTAWSCSLYIADLLWDVPPSNLSFIPPYHISLIARSFTSGALLITLWETANATFSAYVAQEPLKREQPLTSESKDPNATLLNGLKSKRELIKVSRV